MPSLWQALYPILSLGADPTSLSAMILRFRNAVHQALANTLHTKLLCFVLSFMDISLSNTLT
jgi:hypothetical protein